MGHLRSISILSLAAALLCAAHQAHAAKCVFQGRGRTSPRDPEYSRISRRVESFAPGWKSAHPSPQKMAKAGFYLIGPGDTAKCFHCGAEISNWQKSDSPLTCHRRCSSGCRFLREIGAELGGSSVGFRPQDCRIKTRCSDDNKITKICLYCRKPQGSRSPGAAAPSTGGFGGQASFCETILKKIFGSNWALAPPSGPPARGNRGAVGGESAEDELPTSDESDLSEELDEGAGDRGEEGGDEEGNADNDNDKGANSDCQNTLASIVGAKKDLKNGIVRVIDTMQKGLLEKMGNAK